MNLVRVCVNLQEYVLRVDISPLEFSLQMKKRHKNFKVFGMALQNNFPTIKFPPEPKKIFKKKEARKKYYEELLACVLTNATDLPSFRSKILRILHHFLIAQAKPLNRGDSFKTPEFGLLKKYHSKKKGSDEEEEEEDLQQDYFDEEEEEFDEVMPRTESEAATFQRMVSMRKHMEEVQEEDSEEEKLEDMVEFVGYMELAGQDNSQENEGDASKSTVEGGTPMAPKPRGITGAEKTEETPTR